MHGVERKHNPADLNIFFQNIGSNNFSENIISDQLSIAPLCLYNLDLFLAYRNAVSNSIW
jgi:hypothetical protein